MRNIGPSWGRFGPSGLCNAVPTSTRSQIPADTTGQADQPGSDAVGHDAHIVKPAGLIDSADSSRPGMLSVGAIGLAIAVILLFHAVLAAFKISFASPAAMPASSMSWHDAKRSRARNKHFQCIAAPPDVHDAAHAAGGPSVRGRHEKFETNIIKINSWRPPVTGDIL